MSGENLPPNLSMLRRRSRVLGIAGGVLLLAVTFYVVALMRL